MDILFISSFIPKKNAPQAGVNFSYNIIKILQGISSNNVDLLCTYNDHENENDVLEAKEITRNQYLFKISKKRKLYNILKSPFIPSIASVRYDERVLIKLKELSKIKKYDYVILDYTQNLNYYKCIKQFFYGSQIIALEQDVSFLGLYRKSANSNGLKRLIYRFEYNRLKKFELRSLKAIDKVYTVNEKDKNLLSELNEVQALYPFINKWNVEPAAHEGFNIMFWGAMNRKENEDAVKYFIESIWDKVDRKDVKLYIIGANPSEEVKRLASDNIIVTGFVEDPAGYFSIMDLSVVPLRLGAGVKIKVLESLANGIPVVTTSVGAEGIYAENGKDIIITDDPDEFAKSINEIKGDKAISEMIRSNGISFIDENYGFERNKQILTKYIL